jgi:hypothetical protein
MLIGLLIFIKLWVVGLQLLPGTFFGRPIRDAFVSKGVVSLPVSRKDVVSSFRRQVIKDEPWVAIGRCAT